MKHRILVLGGYGHFGARIVRALVQDDDLQVIVAGRDPVKAQALLTDVGDKLEFCRLDMAAHDFALQLELLQADTLIHTAGPFQGQGYSVAQACLEAGLHYIDLADGREFVRHFPGALMRWQGSSNALPSPGPAPFLPCPARWSISFAVAWIGLMTSRS
ncbi:saccharopine dehydrogenase NADP-binding domain-containing protein [Polaromonas sp. P1(28)-13]|nr:saccharopine dehydrogenase NADP-binding domain-containing protein [Polaromonas sp. P1(28)-13]